jgi:Restriction Enzyme Adenine Methylase Associated/Type I restriction enzyme R protein N terminus (HSDR_N)
VSQRGGGPGVTTGGNAVSISTVCYSAAVMTDSDEFREHVARIQDYLSLRLSETDTRVHLVDPILRILGYSAVGDIRREVPVPATKEFLDYELLVDGRPQAIVEAKALRQPITDQHAGQCVQYASVLGIRWCLITNGVSWAVYDAYSRRALAEKLVANVLLDGDDQQTAEAWEVLSLFSRDSLSKPAPLTALLIDRVIADELQRADSAAIAALRRAVKDRFGEQVSSQSVLHALGHPLGRRVPPARQVDPPVMPPPVVLPLNKGQDRARVGRHRSEWGLLAATGILPANAVLECQYRGVTHAARLQDGQIELAGKLYASPSAAAVVVTGGVAINGWRLWKHKGETLSDIRMRLPHASAGATDSNQA